VSRERKRGAAEAQKETEEKQKWAKHKQRLNEMPSCKTGQKSLELCQVRQINTAQKEVEEFEKKWGLTSSDSGLYLYSLCE
jgi:hypothetical protein